MSRHGARDARIGVLGRLQMLPGPGGLVGVQACAPGPAARGSARAGRAAQARARILRERGWGDGWAKGGLSRQPDLSFDQLLQFLVLAKIIYRAEACV